MTSCNLRFTCHCHAPETFYCWRVDSLLYPRSAWYCRRHLLLGCCLLSLDGEDLRRRVDSLLNPRSAWYCWHHLLLGCGLLSLDGEDLRITRFLQESLHTNPFWKIPDYNSRQFTFFKQYFTKSVGPGRFSAEKLKVIWQKDWQTDELIWCGLGNLRFLQV